MEEELRAKIADLAAKSKEPIEDLTKKFNKIKASFKKSILAKDEAWYNQAALRRLFVITKAARISPAIPFDYISLGYTGTMDITRTTREEQLAMYQNEETRQQALDEGKVRIIDGVPTAIDRREWMIPPDPTKEPPVKGAKNRNFNKPLVPVIIRTLVAYGKPKKGGDYKLMSVFELGELTKMTFPIGKSLRTKFNLREDRRYLYVCNASRLMAFDAVQLPEYPEVSVASICNILTKAPIYNPETTPSGIRVPLGLLRKWHDAHAADKRRQCIVIGDVTVKPPDPTSTGNYIVVVDPPESIDLEAEGTPLWVPGELEEQLDFAIGSRVVAVGRTNIGPGRDPETGQIDSAIERVQMNVAAIFALPEYRVPPERLDEYFEE